MTVSKNKITLSSSSLLPLAFHLLKPIRYSVDNPFLIDRNSVVNHKIFRRSSFVQPLFMFFMDLFEIVQGNRILPFSGTFLDSVRAHFGRTLDVDDSCQIHNLVHLHQMIVELQVDCVLGLIENVAVLHDAGEDVSIGEK